MRARAPLITRLRADLPHARSRARVSCACVPRRQRHVLHLAREHDTIARCDALSSLQRVSSRACAHAAYYRRRACSRCEGARSGDDHATARAARATCLRARPSPHVDTVRSAPARVHRAAHAASRHHAWGRVQTDVGREPSRALFRPRTRVSARGRIGRIAHVTSSGVRVREITSTLTKARRSTYANVCRAVVAPRLDGASSP